MQPDLTPAKFDFRSQYDLSRKIVVVTGGTGILGKWYCHGLAKAGAKVLVADLQAADCERLVSEINQEKGGKSEAHPVDLASEKSIKAWAKQILDQHGSIDVLVNNAATKSANFFQPLEKFSLEDWNQVMAVNVTAMFLAARELGPSMVAKKAGSIINVSSIYGLVGPDQRIYEGSWYEAMGGAINTPLIYSATKGAVISMTKHLATYWGAMGVRTNCLAPGGVGSGQNAVFDEKYSARVPMGRMARPQEMVGALAFLASDASAYVNGQSLVVDGGWTAW